MVDLSALWSAEMLLAAFAGGAFGAAIGGQPAFIFTGFLVIAGQSVEYISPDSTAITDLIAFGPVFGPHISFAAGAAASAYAAKKGYMDTTFDYHQAKNIDYAFGTKPDVLIVGGFFGIGGYWIAQTMMAVNAPWDPVAMAVVLSAVLHRVVFGYEVIGTPSGNWLDMRPYEDGEHRSSEQVATDGGYPQQDARLAVEPWLPQQYIWSRVGLLGAVVGILGAYIVFATESVFLGFGISAVSLIFLSLGLENFPVTHHITLPSSTAAAALAPAGDPVSSLPLLSVLITGAGIGVLCALFGELFQRIFYAHGDTHLDPPAAAIVFGTFVVAVLATFGVFPTSSWVPAL